MEQPHPGHRELFLIVGYTARWSYSAPLLRTGAMIVSSLSRHYHALHPEVESRVAAASNAAAGHLYYAEAGTSMATPHAAGIFALWLQADPTLTGPELREIAIASASPLHDSDQLRTGPD